MVTAGIVSALGRNVPVPSDNDTTTTLAGAIQTDASIKPGNSGGALVNCSGQLIGVNAAIATVPNAVRPAGEAGLRAGDVVTQIDGQSANNADVITRVTLTKKAGDTITVKYLRDGHANTATVTLGAIP